MNIKTYLDTNTNNIILIAMEKIKYIKKDINILFLCCVSAKLKERIKSPVEVTAFANQKTENLSFIKTTPKKQIIDTTQYIDNIVV